MRSLKINNIAIKGLVISSLIVGFQLSAVAQSSLTIKDSSTGETRNCTFKKIGIETNGSDVISASINLDNFNCLTASTDDCHIDNTVIKNGESAQLWVQDPLQESDCTNSGKSATRTCTDGQLDGDQKFRLSHCNIRGTGSCIDVDNNTIPHSNTDKFYASASVRCDTNFVTGTCTDGNLSPESTKTMTTNCDRTVSSNGVVDTGIYNDNRTIGPVTDTATGYKVYISDLGLQDTAVPSCVNNLSPQQDCDWRNLWETGAKTNEVYSIRLKFSGSDTVASIRTAPIPFGYGTVQGANFDWVLSSKPGKMTSDLTGAKCEIRGSNNDQFSVITQAEYDVTASYLRPFKCVVPKNRHFYLNIRARSAACDNANVKCQAYFNQSSLLR